MHYQLSKGQKSHGVQILINRTNIKVGQRFILFDFIRAFSIIGVLGFHFFPNLVPGGYLGVDAFFVLSGFLISRQIEHAFDLSRRASSITLFYKKRFLRLFPATILPLIFVYFFFLVFGSQDYFLQVCNQVMFSMLGLANIHFFETTGYFQLGARSMPLLHFWSLSIEIQFYILFPLLYFIFRTILRKSQKAIFFLSLLTVSASLIISNLDFAISYFSTYIRFCELLLGVLSYYLSKSLIFQLQVKSLNLLLICSTILMFSIFLSDFKGVARVLSAVIVVVIVFSMMLLVNQSIAGGQSLISKFLALVGRSSYSIYIYHWIIIVVADFITPIKSNQFYSLLLLVMSLVIGVISYKLIEQPAMVGHVSGRQFKFYISVFTSIFTLSMIGMSGAFGTSKVIDASLTHSTKLEAAKSVGGGPCDYPLNNPDVAKFCSVWNKDGTAGTILVWGDSFSNSWIPVFQLLAKEDDYRILQISHAGCPPLINVQRIAPHYGSEYCASGNLQRSIAESLRGEDFDGIFLIARWNLYIYGLNKNGILVENAPIVPINFDKGSQGTQSILNTFQTSLLGTMNLLSALGPVTTLLQTPTMPVDISLVKNKEGVGIDEVLYSKEVNEVNRIIEGISIGNHSYIDPKSKLCKASFCPAVESSINLYEDDAHPSAFLVFKFEDEIRSRLKSG